MRAKMHMITVNGLCHSLYFDWYRAYDDLKEIKAKVNYPDVCKLETIYTSDEIPEGMKK